MPTVTGISIEKTGTGYTTGVFETLNENHKSNNNGLINLYNLYVAITIDSQGSVITAVPVDGKTGLDYSIGDFVFIEPRPNYAICTFRITNVEGP